MSDVFWRNENQIAQLVRHLPTDTRVKPRVDDLRAISGIVHAIHDGFEVARSALGSVVIMGHARPDSRSGGRGSDSGAP
jgi:hypothetical protein